MPQVQNMPKFRILQSPEFGRVLNMPGFWIWQGSEYAKLNRVLNMLQNDWICLNGTRISLSMSEFTIIDRVLNMCLTIQSVRSLQVNEHLLKDVCIQNPVKDLNCFCKTLYLRSLREFWICARFKYVRVLNTPWLSICQGFEFPMLHRV